MTDTAGRERLREEAKAIIEAHPTWWTMDPGYAERRVKALLRDVLAALAHDRPSGSGLESLRALSDAATPGPWTLGGFEDEAWRVTGPDVPFIVAAVNYVRAALSDSSDPEAVGLDVERLARELEVIYGSGDPPLTDHEYAAHALLVRLTEAKPESPARPYDYETEGLGGT